MNSPSNNSAGNNTANTGRKPTKLPQKPVTQVNRFEKVGYKVANKLHKFGVLTIVLFITGNMFWFAREYNNYWRTRRVSLLKY